MTDIKIMEKLYDNKYVITKADLLLILESLVSCYGVNIIDSEESHIIARYYDKSRKLYINYDNIINISVANLVKNKIDVNNIKYINYKIIQLLFHEVEHIKQFNMPDSLIMDSNQTELTYKKNNTYSYHIYMCNPIERLANISSLNKVKEYLYLMNKNNIGNYFELEYLSNMLYGYYTNKFNYPINIFFDTEELIRYDDYEPKLIGCSITNEEYLKLINKKTLIEKNLDV